MLSEKEKKIRHRRECQAKKDAEEFLIDAVGTGKPCRLDGDLWTKYELEHLLIYINDDRNVIVIKRNERYGYPKACVPTKFKDTLMKALKGTLWR